MTKMIKLSLVAAVAVAGLSTTASAVSLEDAVKNVTVSGQMRLRTESTNTGATGASTSTLNDFDTDIKFKNKLSDTNTIVIKVEADSQTGADASTGGKEAKLDAVVTNAYLQTKAGSATVLVGRQGVPGPFTDGAAGAGLVALVPAGPVTVAAGFFNNTDIAAGLDAAEVAVLGKFGNVAFDVWYANVQVAGTFLSAHANAKVGPVGIDFRHSTGTAAASGSKTGTLTKVVASAKAGKIGLVAGLAITGDDNAVANIAIDGDNDAKTDFKVWQASTGGLNGSTAIVLGVNAPIGSAATVGATYVTATYDASATSEVTVTEILVDAKYKIAKNVSLSGKYSILGNDVSGSNDKTKTRIEVKYTF